MIAKSRLYEINSSRILQLVWQQPGISRIALARELDLDRSTITKIANNYIESGLIRTTGKFHGEKAVGRKATALEINPGFGLVLGIEVQTDFFYIQIIQLDGKIHKSQVLPYKKNNGSLEKQLEEIILNAVDTGKKSGKTLLGAGIGISGIIDPYRGRILLSNPLGIKSELRLKEILKERCSVPVFIENDANCCCWSDIAFRPTRQHRNFLAILGEFRSVDISREERSGIAIGIGIVIRGKVYHGDNFAAGEFRSLDYDYNRPSHVQLSITDEEAATLPSDQKTMKKVLQEISRNISLPITLFDITKVIIAGDLQDHLKELKPLLHESIQKSNLYDDERPCLIEAAPEPRKAVSYGAAGLFISKLFAIPEMTDHTDELVGSLLLKEISP